jgi:hypothetical protein
MVLGGHNFGKTTDICLESGQIKISVPAARVSQKVAKTFMECR